MKDGQKESVKELSAFFRMIFSTDISILLIAISLKGKITISMPYVFIIALTSFFISAISCFYLFISVIPKIYHEDDGIIYQPDTVIIGLLAMITFVSGATLLIVSQLG